MHLSLDQKEVLTTIIDWVKHPTTPYLTVGGYAGTGKTTIIAVLNMIIKKNRPNSRIAYASFTGKASQVLKTKLTKTQTLTEKDFCGTLHSLMYTPQVNKAGKVTNWKKNVALPYDLIIIDEASMVTRDLWDDLVDFKIPILAVGDHGQLPPIGDSFNLMDNPQIKLEKIHRQAESSPIIQLATMARTTGEIPYEKFAPNVLKTSRQSPEAQDIIDRYFSPAAERSETLVLCGKNKTRVQLNQHLRGLLGYETEEPQTGETVICLKNNYENKQGPIYNGMIGYIKTIKEKSNHWYETEVDFPLENTYYSGDISRHQFHKEAFVDAVDGLHYSKIGGRFDFGYALTVHKAQGSQSNTVLLFEERSQFWSDDDWRRWLYTAITRAQNNLYILA